MRQLHRGQFIQNSLFPNYARPTRITTSSYTHTFFSITFSKLLQVFKESFFLAEIFHAWSSTKGDFIWERLKKCIVQSVQSFLQLYKDKEKHSLFENQFKLLFF